MTPMLEPGTTRLKALLGPAFAESDGQLVATPPTTDALVETMGIAAEAGLRVLVAGHGLRADWGNPVDTDLTISTRALHRVVEYAPDDMVITAEAGMTLRALNAHLATRSQVLPLEVAAPERTTLGGLVAAAPMSLARPGYGEVKDWLIGLAVATPTGELVRGGGKVVKNVAGYDLCKLYAGSLGTLGAIATVTFRVRPSWEATALVTGCTAGEAAEALLEAVQTTHLAPTVNLLRMRGDLIRFTLGFDGFQETVDWQVQEASRLFEAHGAEDMQVLRDAGAQTERGALADSLQAPHGSFSLRASLLPSDMLAFYREAMASADGLSVTGLGLAPHGTLWLQGTGEPAKRIAWLDELRAIALRHGGHVTIEGHTGWPREVDAFMLAAPPRELMRRIQAGLDPRGLMAPGRFRLEGARHGTP
ncbi:MAG TPA: FAD-binding oxidoreductase [Stenomitos sp.]